MTKQDLMNVVRSFGAAETAFNAAKKDNLENPPKLQAALAMMAAAEAGDAIGKDAMDLSKAYYEGLGGKLPSSLSAQSSKFAAFLNAGAKNVGEQSRVAVDAFIRGINDPKKAKQARSGIFEKFYLVMKTANDLSAVPDALVLRSILTPDPTEEDAQVKALKAAFEALGKAETATNDAAISEMIKKVEALKAAREAHLAKLAGEVGKSEMAKHAVEAEPVVEVPEPSVVSTVVDGADLFTMH